MGEGNHPMLILPGMEGVSGQERVGRQWLDVTRHASSRASPMIDALFSNNMMEPGL